MKRKQNMEHTPLLVLSLLSREDMYGYQMIAQLENEGAVRCYEQTAPTGRKRKYYALTEKGRLLLRQEEASWRAYQRSIDAVVEQAVLG